MVFSSIQAYLDSSNWQQPPPSSYHQATGAAAGGRGGGGAHILSSPPLSQPRSPSHGCGAGSIRPGSMADRARMANIQMPEAALKCPRCESTNTKFCYFNNYSLTQPRHFCKNCRRYWTRGGSLRNVPVGGGCRRNRRTRSNSSTNATNNSGSSNTAAASGGHNSTIGVAISSNFGSGGGGGGHHESILSQILSPIRFISPSISHLNGLPSATSTTVADSIGLLNYGFLPGLNTHDLSCIEQWRESEPPTLPHLPALGGGHMETASNSSSGFYAFEAAKAEESGYVRSPKISYSISSALATQLASVKMEDHPYKWGGNGTFSAMDGSF